MANELSTISREEIDELTKLRDQFLEHERNWRYSRHLFLVQLFQFGKRHRSDESALNAELNQRKIGFNAASGYWDKVTKLILSRKDGEGWGVADKSRVSKYALVLEAADQENRDPNWLLTKLEEIGIEKTYGEFRRALKGGGTEEVDYLSFLGQGVENVAPSLFKASHKIDLAASGLQPGTVELIASVDKDGKLEIKAIIPVNDSTLKAHLGRVYNDRKPLERGYLQLFEEIDRISKAISNDCGVEIVSDDNGVKVNIVSGGELAGAYWASISSPNFDASYGASLQCGLDISDIRKLKDLRDIKRIYGRHARTTIRTRGGAAFAEISLAGGATFDEANEEMNAGARAKRVVSQPEWIASAKTEYRGDGDKKVAVKKLKFAQKEIPPIASGDIERVAEIGKNEVPNLIKQANAAGLKGKGKATKTVRVSVSAAGLKIGKGNKEIDLRCLINALAQLKALTDHSIGVGMNDIGLGLTAKKRDYEWMAFLPFISK